MVERFGAERISRMQHDAGEILVVDSIWEVLGFQTYAGPTVVDDTALARLFDRLARDVKLHARHVGKTGHADAAFL